MPLQDQQAQRLSELYSEAEPERLVDLVRALGFSARDYLQTNPDLIAAGLDEDAATYHYLAGGALGEQRRCNRTGASDRRAWVAALEAFPLDTAAARMLLVNLLLNRMWSGPSPLDADVGVQRDFLDVCRRRGIRPLLVVGDSHCQVYRVPRDIEGVVHVPLAIVCHGGSAAGLTNAHSRSGFGQRLRGWFDAHADLMEEFQLPCFWKFGQVDAEFVWVFKRAQRGATGWSMAGFEAFVDDAVTRYVCYIEDVQHACRLADRLRVLSIFPPTLSDASWAAGYVNARIGRMESDLTREALSESIRHLTIPTWQERTRLHALWNARVMAECARRGWLYVDDFQMLLACRGVVGDAYLTGHDGADHHLAVAVMGGVADSVFGRYAQVGGGVP